MDLDNDPVFPGCRDRRVYHAALLLSEYRCSFHGFNPFSIARDPSRFVLARSRVV